MEEKMMKARRLSILLALALLVTTFASCSTGGSPSPSAPGSSAPSNSPSASPAASPEASSQDVVTLTYLATSAWGNAPTGLQNNAVMDAITAATGVRLDVIDVGAAGDVDAKLAALLAANDLPDLVSLDSQAVTTSALASGQLAPLDDLIAQYGQDITQNIGAPALDFIRSQSSDGTLRYLPQQVGVTDYNLLLPYVRWDLYAQLGYPAFNSLEDLLTIGKDMLALEPTNSSGQKNYVFAEPFGDAAWGGSWTVWGGPTNMYGSYCNDWSSYAFCNDPNTMTNQLTDTSSLVYRMTHFWYEANQQGLLNPDSFTMKASNVKDFDTAGRSMIIFEPWNATAANSAFTEAGITDKGFEPIAPPADTDQVCAAVALPQGNPYFGIAISNNCKDKEAAMRLLNYLNTYDGVELAQNGVKGVQWDIVDGAPRMLHQSVVDLQADPNYENNNGIKLYYFLSSIGRGNLDTRYSGNITVQFYEDPKTVVHPPLEQAMLDHYNITNAMSPPGMDLVMNNPQIKTYLYDSPAWSVLAAPDDDMNTLMSAVNTYVFNNYIGLITAKNDADYTAKQTAFMNGVVAAGYDTTLKWYQDAMAAAEAKLSSGS